MQLKEDQVRADTARDAAWTELKRCVEEVGRFATEPSALNGA